jgi:hypothetical protein
MVKCKIIRGTYCYGKVVNVGDVVIVKKSDLPVMVGQGQAVFLEEILPVEPVVAPKTRRTLTDSAGMPVNTR